MLHRIKQFDNIREPTNLKHSLHVVLEEAVENREIRVIIQQMYKKLFIECKNLDQSIWTPIIRETISKLKLLNNPDIYIVKCSLIRQLQLMTSLYLLNDVLKPTLQQFEQMDMNALQKEGEFRPPFRQDEGESTNHQTQKNTEIPVISACKKVKTSRDDQKKFYGNVTQQLDELQQVLSQSQKTDDDVQRTMYRQQAENEIFEFGGYTRISNRCMLTGSNQNFSVAQPAEINLNIKKLCSSGGDFNARRMSSLLYKRELMNSGSLSKSATLQKQHRLSASDANYDYRKQLKIQKDQIQKDTLEKKMLKSVFKKQYQVIEECGDQRQKQELIKQLTSRYVHNK